MATLRETVDGYVKRVQELAEHVRGNEQATKQSLIGPFFTALGYDLTDPRECIPEYRADFGQGRSVKPIDWAFRNNSGFTFFVEAKEVGKKLAGFDEQLADYFAKEPTVKLGILTNGAQWRFFTDVVNANVMDREPLAVWDVITLLQKSQFNAELIRAYAQRKRAQNLLVQELSRLLEPATEFAKLAIANIETRNLTQAVVESWKPVVAGALNEWARQHVLSTVLSAPQATAAAVAAEAQRQVETTAEELEAFAAVQKILGPECKIAYEDSVAYFKVHLAERRTWIFLRIQYGKRLTNVFVPLTLEQATPLAGNYPVVLQGGWATVQMEPSAKMEPLADLIRAAYRHVKSARSEEAPEGAEPAAAAANPA